MKEVQKTVKQIDHKAPSLDGMHVVFYKKMLEH